MALGKQDRINLSKKIAQIPEENASIEAVKAQIIQQQQKSIKEDAVNASLQLPYDNVINLYQPELNYLDGKKRTILTSTIIDSAAKGEARNGFFLSDPNFPVPSLPSGVWKFFSPVGFTWAIGKNNAEVYPAEPNGELPTITAITPIITQIETYAVSIRATGFECISGANPTPPPAVLYTSQPNVAIQTLLTNLKTQITKWKASLNSQKSVIVLSETVPARLTQNQAAYNAIDPVLNQLILWESYIDFNSGASCPLSESWSSYSQNKLHPDSLLILKNLITSRTVSVNSRISELNTHFGSIVQDMNSGALVSFSGWYGKRYLILDSRLNLISGTASGKFGSDRAIQTQDQIKASNAISSAAYSLSMKCTKAAAPGIDTPYLNLENASDFNVLDRVYVVADDQEELSGSILEKSGNRVKLTFTIPKKYTLSNYTRMYKLVEETI